MRVLILLALMGAAMAVPKPVQRIVGGNPTSVERHPFMSNMQYGWGITWTQSCGGTLISNRIVVSAAHCYEGDRANQWRVILGTSFASGAGGVEYLVQNIINHPQYSSRTLDNDVSVLWLANVVQFTNSIQPARIAGPNYNVADNEIVTTIGWGDLVADGPSPEQLQEVDINVINHALCAERYAYLKTIPGYQNWPDITDRMLCAGILDVGGKDACQRDSGGPVVHNRDILVGIVSWGYSCADSFYPGINARVSSFSDWIVNNSQ